MRRGFARRRSQHGSMSCRCGSMSCERSPDHSPDVIRPLAQCHPTTHPVSPDHSPSVIRPLAQCHPTTHPVSSDHSPNVIRPLAQCHPTTHPMSSDHSPDIPRLLRGHGETEKTACFRHFSMFVPFLADFDQPQRARSGAFHRVPHGARGRGIARKRLPGAAAR